MVLNLQSSVREEREEREERDGGRGSNVRTVGGEMSHILKFWAIVVMSRNRHTEY